jgi:ElaB/YqjD/DUF883 family membrane-anchored ribosome-binding protein
MDTLRTSDTFASKGQDLADKTADKVQSGIRTVKEATINAADQAASKVESARSAVAPVLGRATEQVHVLANQTKDTLNAAGSKVRATVADVGDSIVCYAQDNPVKTILLSVAVGAALGALVTSSRYRAD